MKDGQPVGAHGAWDGATSAGDRANHVLDVVVTPWHLLTHLCACRSVADEEYAYSLVLSSSYRSGKAQAVVAAFGPIWGIVENEKNAHN